MYQILKVISITYVLFMYMSFISMNEIEEYTSPMGNTFTSKESAVLKDGNFTDIFNEYSHEHIAVQKWRKNDAAMRKLAVMMYDKILPYVANGSKDLDLSLGCQMALMKTLIGLKQYKNWAVKMIDSSGKIPAGILNFNSASLGNYDECLDVNVSGSFQGQYCDVDVSLPLPERQRFIHPYTGIPEFENFARSVSADSVTAELLKQIRFLYYQPFHTAVCVPSTCSKDEIQTLGNKVIQGLEIYADVVVNNCEVLQEKTEFRAREIAIMTALAILLFIGITATVVDVYLKLMTEDDNYKDTLNLPIKYLLCFSFYTNTKRLVAPDTSMDTIKVFHGMRVFSMSWIILGHTYGFQNPHADNLRLNLFLYSINDISFQVLLQAFMPVDTFFFIGAVVHSYGLMKLKGTKINYCLHILRRILRLSIPFVLVMPCVFLIPYLGSGPVWKETMESHLTENCRSNWWTNLLFINNFLPRKDMCLEWFWYIPVDTHLFLLSLLVVIPMRSRPRLAFAINLLILLGGICIAEVFRYYYGLTKVPSNAYGHVNDYDYLIVNEHYRTYEHISSMCVGLVVGYILATRSFKMSIPWKVNVTLWLSAFILALTVIFGTYEWNQDQVPNIIICILYKSTKKFWWSLALGWVTIACTTGNGGIVYDILAWSGFVVLARLTYMVYLIHPIIIFMYLGSTRTLIEMTHRSLVYIYIGNLMLSYMCAYVCILLFESPFQALQNVLLSSYIPDDIKILKNSNFLKKEETELKKTFLDDHVHTKEYNRTGKKEDTKHNPYDIKGYRYHALID